MLGLMEYIINQRKPYQAYVHQRNKWGKFNHLHINVIPVKDYINFKFEWVIHTVNTMKFK